jgi:sulfur carrier protein ThiS
MLITLRLRSLLDEYLPWEASGDEIEINVEEEATPADLIDRMGIPGHRVHLVLRNGRFVSPEQRRVITLREGDVVELWPLVAGG